MKNLFEVDGDEIKRILSLHESSTKKQYLNVISEQAKPATESFTLADVVSLENKVSGQPELKLFKGAVFKIAKKNLLYSKTKYQTAGDIGGSTSETMSGTIWYNCATGKFSVRGQEPIQYYNESYPTLTTKCTDLCAKSKTFVKPATQDKTKKVVDPSKVKTGYVAPLNPQQMVDTIKQVQQSVGIQNPTGQITDTDVDALIAKLSEN